jgi:hypothetical protein
METGTANICCAVKRPGAVLPTIPEIQQPAASLDRWHNISITLKTPGKRANRRRKLVAYFVNYLCSHLRILRTEATNICTY